MKKKIFLLFLFSFIFCTKKILIDIPMNIQNEKKQTWHPKINRDYLDESLIEIPKKSQEKYETTLIQRKQPFLGFKKNPENIEKKKCTCRFVKDENINENQINYQQINQPQQQIIQPQQQLLTNNQIPFNNQQPQQIIVQQPQPQPQQIYPNQMMYTNPQQPVYYQNNNNNMLYPNQNNLGNVQNLPLNTEPNKIIINNNPYYPPSNIQPNVQNNAIPVFTTVVPQQIQGFLTPVNF
jgi:hypothetical protein